MGCGRSSRQAEATTDTVEPAADATDPASTTESASHSDSRPSPAKTASNFVHPPAGAQDDLFTNRHVPRIQLEIPRAGINILHRGGWGNGQKRPVAKIIVREGDKVYTNVAVHLKGAAGSFRQIDDRPALTLNFDTFAPGQTFHGLRKISLNNSVQDPSYLCEKFAREMFLQAGVPVPRAAHALVELNGRDLGLYVLLEGANKQFLKGHFANTKGNLYDGGFCQDVDGSLSVNCGDNPNNHSGLQALLAALSEPRPTFARLDQVLDVDRFLSMMAIEVMLGHWDGYTMNRNNWRTFHDLDAKKMVFIPHGLDQLFGVGRGFQPNAPIMPGQVSGDVARAILATREGQRRYRERAAQLFTNVFNLDRMTARIDQITSEVTAEISPSHPGIASLMQRQASSLKRRIVARENGLRRQFGIPVIRTTMNRDGTLPLKDWNPATVRSGEPRLSQIKDTQGVHCLNIQTGEAGTSSSSWRTRAVLSPGQYQFSGRVRLENVTIDEGDTRGGVALRVSKGNAPRKWVGSRPWTRFVYDFTVENEDSDVEFICELRGNKGEAWFDLGSLQVQQIP